MENMVLSVSFALLLTLFVGIVTASETDSVVASRSWTVYHAWNNGEFTRRGDLKLELLPDSTEVQLSMDNDDNIISSSTNNDNISSDGWYQVKVVDNENPEHWVMTSVLACELQRANFRDEWNLFFGVDQIISVSYIPLVSPLAPKECTPEMMANNNDKTTFQSKVSYDTAIPGMQIKAILPHTKPPPGLEFYPNPNKQGGGAGGAGNKGGIPGAPPQEEEQLPFPFGFLKRYWYVLLPLFLANFLGPPEEDPQQQQQGQQQGGGQGQQANTAPASAPSGGSVSKRTRRGKRD